MYSSTSALSNRSFRSEDTIAAISTPFGESGIGIVRMSGPLSEPILRKIFLPSKATSHLLSHRFYYGEIADPDTKAVIDEVLVVAMRSPKTYTREDIVEIHCHGGYLILERVLELVLRQGARLAEPGEFTRRAFLNGRIDLTQAEAVIDLIKAKTEVALEMAHRQRRGGLHREIMAVKEALVEGLTLVEAHIDFPEEEIESLRYNEMASDLERVSEMISKWLETYETGRIFRDGVSCAIVGKTNVGKSSLLNVLVSQERAIVTPMPGTTRDVIEEVLNIRQIPVRLMDTAGLRRTGDWVELEGVKRTKQRMAEADLVILVVDGSRALDEEDWEIFRELGGRTKVVAVNKNDLPSRVSLSELKGEFKGDRIVSISALHNVGIGELKDAIYERLIQKDMRVSQDHLVIANLRHKDALHRARENIESAQRGLREQVALEFIAFDIRSALEALGEIVGETATEEVLDRIFSKFCIGK